jgi:hypothetical protein
VLGVFLVLVLVVVVVVVVGHGGESSQPIAPCVARVPESV